MSIARLIFTIKNRYGLVMALRVADLLSVDSYVTDDGAEVFIFNDDSEFEV